jgi:hypothetical protein
VARNRPSQDLAGVMALYADHAVMETPTILARFPDRGEGILGGRSEIEKLFARNFKTLAAEFRELYRTGLLFSNGRHLTWEYPHQSPGGAQIDLLESMDIERGLIAYHRIYWGWQGLKPSWPFARRPPPEAFRSVKRACESRPFFFAGRRAIFAAQRRMA